MTEQRPCFQVAFTGTEEQPTSRELAFHRDGKSYLISITTPDHLEGLRKYNLQFHPSVQLDENFFVVPQLPSVEDLCNQLSQIPTDQLQPYLTEQVDPKLP